ncbi:GATA zinc finger domain-containing protein 10 isoform X2 [Ooceraea biroi]|uniref:GATA zinc finger domain-containing protein 10 isoform X2 n=1 Tax=Ooceraea biroi TaxID=2015173 RepID=UPI0005BAAAFF|nr:GATA zinc finger domain-containing protein 10 isoform X2 [Ooceraea biroi]
MRKDMKILLIAIASFVVIEATGGWEQYGPGVGSGRGNNVRGTSWGYPQQINQNAFGSDVEWVCQSPKTNDIMVIATDNTRQQYPGRGPWWQWQNVPPGHQNHHQPSGNYWTQPIIIVQQEPTRTDGTRLPFTTPQMPTTHNNNDGSNNNNNNNHNNHQPNTTPQYHGGEGIIDIRLGEQ